MTQDQTRASYDAVAAAYAEVNVSFRFFDPAWLSAELERAGFAVESLTRRQPYPGAEVATPRAYILARAV